LKTAAAISTASSLPNWFLDECRANPQAKPTESANDKPSVALIGCSGRGRGIAKNASQFGNVVAVCDVDDTQLAVAQQQWPKAKSFKDFRSVVARQDVDIVVCGTVDHWHTLVSIAAMRAGKDVYCEKPLTLTVEIGHRSASVCHLGVIAIRLRRELKFDPLSESFVGDAQADQWLSREMRQPWSYESV